VSQGVPMLLMGDEVGRTQKGNNNAYCLDNEVSWLDWGLRERNAELFEFARQCIAFRKAHRHLRDRKAVRHPEGDGAVLSWHGPGAWHAAWAGHSRTLAFMLSGGPHKGGEGAADHLYVAMNVHWESHTFGLPGLPGGNRWHVFANTALPPPHDVRA